jgi:hypothetical protein
VIVQASIVGILKTVLILIGTFVLLRFIGQLMIAKRNLAEEKKLHEDTVKAEKERINKLKNFGKISILSGPSKRKEHSSITATEDVDFEEIE